MFMDSVRIHIASGPGGDGAVAWHREKYVPSGGPSGGDGGRGGSVIFEATPSLTTLVHFKQRRHFTAARGGNGEGGRRHGKNGDDLIVQVPVGTAITDDEGNVFVDLVHPGDRWIAAKGGQGGRGNARFATPTRQAPAFAERGEPGTSMWVRCELRLLADVGLVGYPNVGKSTLISVVSAARPKIADYPFTTLVPNLGVVSMGDGNSFVVADIPGIIEGAHEGVGLGHRFLRHIERTAVLLHVVDASGREGRHPVDDLKAVEKELANYSDAFAEHPRLIAANMMDLPDAVQYLPDLKRYAAQHHIPLYPISAVTQQGVKQLTGALWDYVKRAREAAQRAQRETPGDKVYTLANQGRRVRGAHIREFSVARDGDVFVVAGEGLRRYLQRVDTSQDAVIRYLQHLFSEIGVYKALRDAGATDGDTVRVEHMEFNFVD